MYTSIAVVNTMYSIFKKKNDLTLLKENIFKNLSQIANLLLLLGIPTPWNAEGNPVMIISIYFDMYAIKSALPRGVLLLCCYKGNPRDRDHYFPEVGLTFKNATWKFI